MVLDTRAAIVALVAVGLVAPFGGHAEGKPKRSAKTAAAGNAFGPERVKIERHVLPNGLVVLMHEEHGVPAVAFWQLYKVGSRNEEPGITGISHFFEHMMFNGSKNVPPKEYDRIIESNGGYSNAFTDRDMTGYYEEIAADRAEVLFKVDADRMAELSLLPDLLKSEVEVVKEERRLRVDNDIFGMLDEQLYATAFNASPYRWPVIGWMGDLERMQREELVDYFRTYYAPNNCVLVLVGDFEPKQALAGITKEFGGIPRQQPPAEPVDSEPEQRGERRVQVHYPAQNVTVMIGYKAPSVKSPDLAALDVVSSVLSDGESSRIHKALVYDQQIALSAGTSYRTRLMPTLFEVYAEMRPGKTAAEGIKSLDDVLAKFVAEGPTERELQKAKNQIEADFIRSLKTNNGLGQTLAYYEYVFGDYREMFKILERYRAVTAADCKRAAKAVFDARKRTVAELVPEAEPTAGEGAQP